VARGSIGSECIGHPPPESECGGGSGDDGMARYVISLRQAKGGEAPTEEEIVEDLSESISSRPFTAG
jgi:hypothetical protein